VGVAKLLNATLVVPHLYHHAIWKDRRSVTTKCFLGLQGLERIVFPVWSLLCSPFKATLSQGQDAFSIGGPIIAQRCTVALVQLWPLIRALRSWDRLPRKVQVSCVTVTSGHVVLSSSTFEEIYDVQHFISTLSRDVEIIRQLPRQYAYLMEDDRQKTKVRDRGTGPRIRTSFFLYQAQGRESVLSAWTGSSSSYGLYVVVKRVWWFCMQSVQVIRNSQAASESKSA
jgi:hypothetical protein